MLVIIIILKPIILTVFILRMGKHLKMQLIVVKKVFNNNNNNLSQLVLLFYSCKQVVAGRFIMSVSISICRHSCWLLTTPTISKTTQTHNTVFPKTQTLRSNISKISTLQFKLNNKAKICSARNLLTTTTTSSH